MDERDGTLVGVVVPTEESGAGDPHLCDVRMSIDGEDERHIRTPSWFELETDAGERVRVDMTGAELLPRREIDGRYGDLLEDPLAIAVLDVAPGDHVRVTLEGAVVHSGTRVHVDGRIRTESEVPTRMTAAAVATGPEAEMLLHDWGVARNETPEPEPEPESKPKPKPDPFPVSSGPGLGLAVILGALGALGIVAGGTWAPYDDAARLGGLNLLAAAIFVWRRRRWLSPLESFGRSESGTGLHWRVGPWIAMSVIVVLFAGGMTAFGAVSSSTNSTDVFLSSAGPIVLASFPLVLLGALVYSDGTPMKRALRMLRTERLGPDAPNGAFGSVQGTVDQTLQVTWNYAMTTTESRTERRGEDGTIEVSHSTSTSFKWMRSTSGTRTCTLSFGDALVEVELEGALFGAGRRELVFPSKTQYLPGGHRTSSSSSETVAYATLTESTAPGDDLLLVGRIRREGDRIRIAAAGEESLFAFGAPADARATLRSQILASAGALVTLGGLAGAGFVLLA